MVIFTHGFGEHDAVCSFAAINLTQDLLRIALTRREFVRTLATQDVDVAAVVYWDCSVTWFNEADVIEAAGDEDLFALLKEQAGHFDDHGWCVLQEVPKAEAARTDDDVMVVDVGGISFRCKPKHRDHCDTRETLVFEWPLVERWLKESGA